ncbi:DODA-type extradiol aromatic ring-opening family dioxygenase [Algihabitans albus]|uniref:DODA-type extradiol aromatic ring-opening family dioxygenase n=1 Tax=Algihabitans albus TaxID=2164067 RepID=UPI000E5CC549|nr:hypothetical protein [Algihabitans albus]
MGRIVGAFATSHILMERKGVEEQADRVFAGLKSIREKIAALKPDIILIVTNDHMYNHGTALQSPFAVGLANEYTPYGDMNVPQKPFKGHTEFGVSLVETAAEEGFDIGFFRQLRPDHGLSIPALFFSPQGRIPVVPFMTNPHMRPCPSPARCYALGKALRKTIETNRPEDERIVVVGTGGLSHWLAIPRMGEVNVDYDSWVLGCFESGKAEDVAGLEAAEILERAGNGGLETLNWLVMAGAVDGAKGRKIFYEAMPAWLTGMAAIEMHV